MQSGCRDHREARDPDCSTCQALEALLNAPVCFWEDKDGKVCPKCRRFHMPASMPRYKIVEKLTVAYISKETDEQAEVFVEPGDGEFWFDGANIMYRHYKGDVTITTTWINSFIDQMVEAGRLALKD